ncbi:LysM peptidoglycan-binding domain-containing protein [Tenacibaculum sp. IB213877]|uniref:LysM peptidoglycan-binding domain-containing protein n=1 Tax=Tenacibaculum sp. IB213877 TaxID=3097351 RepID=UPI002A5A3097|nr:LysM peptidoglycan-binding domain-containing protein [Tenacibaculum sp. IB213877]MDY0781379.1 LysM peptidoglycan-binding domain-containing protein [Tenacibaculum sp. IB213877]
MIKSKIKFLVFAFVFSIAISCGQQKRYITYQVKQGESMRDIANRLDVRTKDLLRLNPDVGRRPDANTTIIIPNPKFKGATTSNNNVEESVTEEEVTPVEETNSTEEVVENENTEQPKDTIQVVRITYEYVTHTVQPKETVYGITKKYEISKDELLKLNPEYPTLKDNLLSIGQVLKVKATETKTFVSLEEDLKNHVTHEVQPKETVYSITRFYNITKEDLILLNPDHPNIADDYIDVGEILRIRTIENKLETDNKKFYEDIIDMDEEETIDIAFLLPFKADEYTNTNAKDVFKENVLANMVTDFYMGAEIALDSIKAQGISFNAKIYDTGNRDEKVSELLDNDALEDADVIIGPFYSDKVEEVAKGARVPVIFPHYSKNQGKFSSSKIIKTEADTETHTNFLVSYLKDSYNGENIFIVGDETDDSNKQISTLVSGLKRHDSILEIHVLKPENGYIKKERFTDKMPEGSHNWIIITSIDNVVVADALNSMVVLPEGVTAQVYAVEKGAAYDKMDNNKLARINFSYVANNYTDENAEETKAFNRKFKDRNKTIPSDYAVKGFDITYDILMRLASGKKLSDTFDEGVSIRLENKFDYDKKLFGSVSNKGLFIVKYNKDLSLQRLK